MDGFSRSPIETWWSKQNEQVKCQPVRPSACPLPALLSSEARMRNLWARLPNQALDKTEHMCYPVSSCLSMLLNIRPDRLPRPPSAAYCLLPAAFLLVSVSPCLLVPCLSPACLPVSRKAHNYRAIDKHGCKFFPVFLIPIPKSPVLPRHSQAY